jgi:membrane protein DedA with SNARE-associated domain
MATAGAVLGGYITYALARKGGKEALQKKFPEKKLEKLVKKFEKKGFGGIAIAAMLPPPFPIVPVLVAAGGLQYPKGKFLGALALGRGIRFMVVAGMGAIYGDAIVSFFSKYYKPALITLISLAVIGGILALVQYLKYRHRHTAATATPKARHAA